MLTFKIVIDIAMTMAEEKETNHKYAGFWPRLLAHNIDLLPILVLFYAASYIIPQSEFDYLFISGIYFSYHIFFEISPLQGTPGKKWTKIKVTNSQFEKIGLLKAAIRNLSKVLSLILLFSGFVIMFFNHKRRALHDYIGGTLVLFDED